MVIIKNRYTGAVLYEYAYDHDRPTATQLALLHALADGVSLAEDRGIRHALAKRGLR